MKDKKFPEAWWKTEQGCSAEQQESTTIRFLRRWKELEQKKSEEVLLLVQKRHDLWINQDERD